MPYNENHGFGWQIVLSVIRELYKLFIFVKRNRIFVGRPYAQHHNFVKVIKEKEKKTRKKNETLCIKAFRSCSSATYMNDNVLHNSFLSRSS